MKIVITFLLLAFLIINSYAEEDKPFEITHVVSVPNISPGDKNIALEFILQNNKDVTINNAKIHLFLKPPFSASIQPNNKLGELSYPGYLISAGGSGDEYTPYFNLGGGRSHKTTFKIDIERNAEYGNYDLPYIIYYDNKEYSGKITLSIKGDTLIEIKNFSVISDSRIEPGNEFKLRVSLENVGDNEIKWLKLKLTPKDKELVPLSSDSEHIFKDMKQGMEKETEFLFSIEKEAEIKNYQINIALDYMDERGIIFNETKLVGISTSGKAVLDIAKMTTDPIRIKEAQEFTLTLKIENTGTGSAKGVTAKLEMPFEGDKLAYLGEIKKDDYSNALFTLDTKEKGEKNGILHITYNDDFGKHEIQKEVIITVKSEDGQSMFPGLVIVALLIGGVYFWIKRKK